MTERDERALRQALQDLGSDDPVDVGQVRRRAAERRRNGRTVAGLAVALVLVAGVVGLPADGGRSQRADQRGRWGSGRAGGGYPLGLRRPAAESEPPHRAGRWPRRRPIRLRMAGAPSTSATSASGARVRGYAVPPQSDWCADEPRGEPRADQRRPYVWLGSDLPVRRIGCPAQPASLLTEHVEALAPGPAVDYVEGAVRQGGWWVVTRFAGSAVLVVTTKDQARAERILNSAQVEPEGAPCTAQSPIAGPLGTRPDGTPGLSRLSGTDGVVLCQYEPVVDPADAALPRLRAAVHSPRRRRRRWSPSSSPRRSTTRPATPLPSISDRTSPWWSGSGSAAVTHDVYVNPAGCPNGSGMSGGIDDGTTVRVLTRPACQKLLAPPLALWSASGDVGRNCLG